MIAVRNIKLRPDEKQSRLKALAARALRLDKTDITELKIIKRSLDARKKSDIFWLYSVAVAVNGDEDRVIKNSGCKNAGRYEPFKYDIPEAKSDARPVVAGFGPAGMFSALVMAQAGLRPIVLERGGNVDERGEKVRAFWEKGELDESSNVQFGEGGAGTFSDGKLNTGTHDERISWVLSQFCLAGAPESICYDAKPHMGTNVLAGVVKNIREKIISLGGEVRFCSKLVGLDISGGQLCGVRVENDGVAYDLECDDLVLAIGHSARDTLEMLLDTGLPMERKSFSMGVRIEHLQKDVSRAQYGEMYKSLPAADYKLNCKTESGSTYTFCMCPGGYVVAASSEKGGVATNGMSYSGRGGENANSALLVTLNAEDFPDEGVLAGMRWQREIERRAFEYAGGNYFAPAQTVGDFLKGAASAGGKKPEPTYKPGVFWGDLHQVLPQKICSALEEALPELGKRLGFFADENAVMTAPETRSSSPVRILREGGQSTAARGLFPCGEGAGYAGGIVSAAVDGMRCAEKIIEKYR